MNTARKIIEYPMVPQAQSKRAKETHNNKRWCYVDLDEFERLVRNDERTKVFTERMERENEINLKRTRELRNSRYFIFQRTLGLLVLIATFMSSEPFYGPKMFLSVINIIASIILMFTKKKMFVVKYK